MIFYGSVIKLNRSVLNRFYIFEIRSDFVTRALRRSALGFDSAYAPLKMTNEVGRKRSHYSCGVREKRAGGPYNGIVYFLIVVRFAKQRARKSGTRSVTDEVSSVF